MQALAGDRIVVESERASRAARAGVIEDVLSLDPPRFMVRWADGCTSIFTPNAGVARVVAQGRRATSGGQTRTRSGDKGGRTMSQQLAERRTESPRTGRWDPLGEFEQITDRMQRMLDRTFGGVSWPSQLLERDGWSPIADVEEQDDAYVVNAELPGVKREDITIELVGNELTISGEMKEEKRKGVVRKQMRRFGRFDYRLTLPDQLDPEKVDAKLKDGVLTVRVPKAEKAQRRLIEVKAS
jgi:HSP20 family protein